MYGGPRRGCLRGVARCPYPRRQRLRGAVATGARMPGSGCSLTSPPTSAEPQRGVETAHCYLQHVGWKKGKGTPRVCVCVRARARPASGYSKMEINPCSLPVKGVKIFFCFFWFSFAIALPKAKLLLIFKSESTSQLPSLHGRRWAPRCWEW